jgi:probable HAF family extracellular repeat protein
MRRPILLPLLMLALVPAACGEMTAPGHAGERPAASHSEAAEEVPRYVVTHLEALGTASSRGNGISNRGLVAGFSHPGQGEVVRATLWRDGVVHDLGTLGGDDSNSSVAWAGVNEQGWVVGITETGEPDELGQPWSCRSFFPSGTPSGRRCVGFLWDGSEMTALPALGGGNSYAAGLNNRGQVVGWAETDILDDTCRDGQVRQFRAVVWEPRKGTTTELPPLPGDSASAATAINASGRVVGISGECDQAVGRRTALHAVVWEGGTPRRLPTLDGELWHTPTAINARGEIAGFSLSGEGFRAVFWDRDGEITNLGTLDGDAASQAGGINARGHVVGVSHGGDAGSRAFLWRGDELHDLNELAPEYHGVLLDARSINDAGVITGWALDPETGQIVTFVATPVGDADA